MSSAPPRSSRASNFATTWKKGSQPQEPARRRSACLTVCAHADASRIGERAVLYNLVLRKPVALSRVELELSQPGSELLRPLEDPFLSRTPIVISGEPKRGLSLHYERDDLRIDGEPARGEQRIEPEALERGVVLELAERVVLLLHLVEGPPRADSEALPGQSDAIEAVRRDIARIAPLDVPVLIRGETGSGKERVAQALHRASARAAGKLVSVNMAAVPTATASSVLFGHARGAFTGAVTRHAGLFEQADGGTLFLDEIGETPDDVQPMLLRVLETGTFAPLGDPRERQVDVRVIAATDADLEREVAQGHFRAALSHRLAGYEIWVPPLRERRDDIMRLLMRVLREELDKLGEAQRLEQAQASDELPYVPASLAVRLLRHPLPGNVRQLRNLARRIALASAGAEQLLVDATAERLLDSEAQSLISAPPPPLSEPRPSQPPRASGSGRRPQDIADAELLAALESSGWSPRRAALVLGIPTSSVHDLMKRCPGVRKAKDIADDELREALAAASGDTEAMAASLRVSERALRLTLRERDLLDE